MVANYSQDIIQLIARLSLIASKRLGISRDALGRWSAHPIVVSTTEFM